MNDTMCEEAPEGAEMANSGQAGEGDTQDVAPAPPRAWVVAFGSVGLLNVVAESQEELVQSLGVIRNAAVHTVDLGDAAPLFPIRVLRTNVQGAPAMVWIDPLLIEAVLDEAVPPQLAGEAPGMPPGLREMLARMEQGNVASDADGVVEVTVEEPTGEEPNGTA